MAKVPDKRLDGGAWRHLRTGIVLAAGGAVVAAGVGAVLGVHNEWTSDVPAGIPGASVGAVLGALMGVALAVLTPRRGGVGVRALGGLAFGALLGLVFGLPVPGWPLPPGAPGALAGATLAAAVLVCLRYRVVLGLLACAWVTGGADPETFAPAPQAPDRPAPATGYDVEPQALAQIPAGTVIPDGPPEGWSNLVLKTHCRVSAGDVNKFPRSAADAVAALFNAILADVEASPGPGGTPRYRLGKVAGGVGTRIGGRDVIVTPATQERLGADLNFVTRLTLDRHHKRAARTRVVVRSATMDVIDDPAFLFQGGSHRPVVLRFALLVRPTDGRLDTLVWRIDGSQRHGYEGAAGLVEWLSPSQVEQSELHADAREFTWGLPQKDSALALTALPHGRRQLAFTPALRDVAGRIPLTAEDAAALEGQLRKVVSGQ
jgi:hypothetical protein